MRWHRTSLESPHSRPPTDRDPGLEEEDDVDEQALARLTESFHSELGPSSARRKHVSWSKERRSGSLGRSRQSTVSAGANRLHQSLHMTSPSVPSEDVDFAQRGRPASRPSTEEPSSSTWSSQRRNSRASRKGAGMVFLGVWALFGVGTLANSGRGLPTSTALRIGRVFARDEYAIPGFVDNIPTAVVDHPPKAHVTSPIDIHPLSSSHENDRHHDSPHDPDEPSSPSTEYIIGRISAWICTTMYLTSRLPQIWKNVSPLQMYAFAWTRPTEVFVYSSLGSL